MIPGVHVPCPLVQPLRDGPNPRCPFVRPIPPEHVQGDEDERRPPTLEGDGVGRPGELAVEGARIGAVERRVGDDEFARQSADPDRPPVEDESQSLVVAGAAAGHVREDEPPVRAERLHRVPERLQVAAHLLERHHVEPADDLRDDPDRVQVAFRAVVVARPPLLGQATEMADVPRADQ